MTVQDRWEDIARIFGLVMDADDAERAAILDRECADDAPLRSEVEQLLAADVATAGDVFGVVAGAAQELVTQERVTPRQDGADVDLLALAGLAPGELIDGRYAVTGVLGAGGMGVVVAAEHRGLDESVAIKLLRPGALSTERVRRRFMREAKAAARIKSAHVVKVRDVGLLPTGAPYMVMELLTGADLSAVLRARSPLTEAEACLITLQACEALATAHVRGVVHRDIKPGNLFLERAAHGELALKLLDFGISKLIEGEPDEEGVLTRTSDMVGSPAYMSPEQLRSARDVDARSDIWSLGVVLFEMLEGTRPYRADNIADLSMAILAEAPPPLDDDASPPLQRIVRRCLEKERDARYQDVGALARALAPFCGEEGLRIARRVIATLGAPPHTLEEEEDEDDWALAETVASSERYPPATLEPGEEPGRAPPMSRGLLVIAIPIVVAAAIVGVVVSFGDDREAPAETNTVVEPNARAEIASTPSPASSTPPAPSSTASSTHSPPGSSTSPSTAPPPRTHPVPPPVPTVDPYGSRN